MVSKFMKEKQRVNALPRSDNVTAPVYLMFGTAKVNTDCAPDMVAHNVSDIMMHLSCAIARRDVRYRGVATIYDHDGTVLMRFDAQGIDLEPGEV